MILTAQIRKASETSKPRPETEGAVPRRRGLSEADNEAAEPAP